LSLNNCVLLLNRVDENGINADEFIGLLCLKKLKISASMRTLAIVNFENTEGFKTAVKL
jgi:hypothetical protein